MGCLLLRSAHAAQLSDRQSASLSTNVNSLLTANNNAP